MALTDKYISHPGAILADVKITTFVKKMAMGIARAQRALDHNSVKMAKELAETKLSDITGVPGSGKSLLELGLSPAFYHFPEVELKVSMMLHIREERTRVVDADGAINGGDQSAYNKNTSSVGTAELTVLHRPASPARGVLTLSRNAPASVEVAGRTFELLAAGSPGLAVETSLKASADALAAAIREMRAQNAPVIAEATVSMVQLQVPTMATSEPAVFQLDRSRGRIRVVHGAAAPAIKIIAVAENDPGSITVPGSGTTTTVQIVTTASAGDARRGLTAQETAVNLSDALDARFASGSSTTDAVVLAIYFQTRKSDVLPSGQEAVDLTIQYLRENPDEQVILVGHADRTGDDDSNHSLSLARAQAVADLLFAKGVGTDRMKIKGLGETAPASNDLSRNRRVEILLTRNGGAEVGRNLVVLRSLARGATATLPITVNGSVAEFWRRDGRDGLPVGGETVTVNRTTLGVTADFAIGATASATAVNLCAALKTALATLTFTVSGDFVLVEGGDTVAQIALVTEVLGEDANALTLTAPGTAPGVAEANPLVVATPFRGARDPAELAGATVAVGAVTLTAGTDFQGGGTQEQTAENIRAVLGTRLNPPFKFERSIERPGNVIEVTGPSGTPLRATPPGALKFSAAALPGQPNEETLSASESEAYMASADMHNTKKFEIDITGFSELKVRMVAIPAPVEFLDEIKTYLGG